MVSVEEKVIRDKEFAKRIAIACENHPHAPSGHGRQRWVYETLRDKFHIELSPEAVSKWFKGVSRPRRKVMTYLARILEVDEAWLSLGITPDIEPKDMKRHNAMVDGYVNVIAGLIQLNGGHIAFSEDRNDPVSFFAIIGGRQHSVYVRVGRADSEGALHFVVPNKAVGATVLGVVAGKTASDFDVLRLSSEIVQEHAKSQGDYMELSVERKPKAFVVGGSALPVVRSFMDLDGERPKGI